MIGYENTPETCTETFDLVAVLAIAKLAKQHALDEKFRPLSLIIEETDISKFPEGLQKRSVWQGEVADELYEAMFNCVRYGIQKQKSYVDAHFRKMFMSCVGKGS